VISFQNQIFHGQTQNTSYLVRIRDGRYLEQLYYGRRIQEYSNYKPLFEKMTGYANSNVTPVDRNLTLDNLCLEYSYAATGDFRQLPLSLQLCDDSYSNNFLYESHQLYEGTYRENQKTKMPYARRNVNNPNQQISTLEIILKDSVFAVYLRLIYTFFYDTDVIIRRVKLENRSGAPIRIEKIMSLMLDLPEADFELHTYDGLWGRERHENIKKLVSGTYVNDSMTGNSSNRHNPFLMLTRVGVTQNVGECFGVHLIYSGNHYEAIEVSEYGKLRIMSGINPNQFNWQVDAEQDFYTPEAVLSFSSDGTNGLSQNMHNFVNQHIISTRWQGQERPVLINNWEGTYFNFDGEKLYQIAKESAKLGIEMFVMDDGWFMGRNDDTSSLGDWIADEGKLGCSLLELVAKINSTGLDFGLWFEPEMISENSSLFRAHPDWAIQSIGRERYMGRNQHVLDLTRAEVRDYIVKSVSDILQSCPIKYVKWDMNRQITDACSQTQSFRQGEFYHRYVLGLYEISARITSAFPDILFEGCSAGGNRFDLGVLFYMPQIWTSDDTDANQRTWIQEGTAAGYPLSTMSAHVSAVPNHQTLRDTSLEARFHVACFGVLGYELDVEKLTQSEKNAIAKQVAFYKQHRQLFQFGTFYRLPTDQNHVIWQVVAADRKEAAVLVYQRLAIPNPPSEIMKLCGLLPQQLYQVTCVKEHFCVLDGDAIEQPWWQEQFLAYGDLLMYAGVKLPQQVSSTEWKKDTRAMGDFSSQIYLVQSVLE
jgi:alpha-galactosidase